ncbi:Protein of unknown function [Pyronema omphalodes CBS 100304]|uniref:Uncharacterized protein n=1 Tax=Pyronema omphalodes (strain CBS 100304) TaxID=1076935 RepID=U4KVL6_PYROM|nr:Protein of unknown function [Pyronema omphalodes CBS 100304]CCX14969.1 Protein of unknown function [Pyronema omphalodes CBS 100304]
MSFLNRNFTRYTPPRSSFMFSETHRRAFRRTIFTLYRTTAAARG